MGVVGCPHIGDFALGSTIDIKFSTMNVSEVPATLAGTPVISAYIGNDLTQLTAGITLTVDFDSMTGLNNVRVVASGGNGYTTGTDVVLVITTGTVNSVSVVGMVVGAFSIEKCSSLRPTTAGRTLVVDSAGLADANVVKVGPTGAGTAQAAGDIYTALAKIATVEAGTAQAGASGSITLRSGASAVDSFYPLQIILLTGGTGAGQARVITNYVGSTRVATVDRNWTTNPDSSSTYSILGSAPKLNLSGEVVAASVTGAVASVTGGVIVTTNNDKTGYGLSSAGIQAIWDALTSALTTSGSIGKWILDKLDVVLSTRLATSGYIAPDNTNITAIAAKVAPLPASPAAVSDIPTANANADALLDRTAGIQTNWTLRQGLRVILAALAGKLSGAATTTVVIRDPEDTKDRITGTVDASGDRTAVTYDKS